MADLKDQLKKALEELRKEKERKFDQTVEVIFNLQKFDVKKNQINIVINVPHKIKEKKIAAFLETKRPNVDTITEAEFKNFANKRDVKKLVDRYDFFLAQASLMPKVATTFGKALGPAGKMPSPQLGILPSSDEKLIDETKKKVNKSVKIRAKESSIKMAIGKQSMPDEQIVENVLVVYETLLKNLTREKENVKNIELKFTMTKPQKISIR